MTNTSTSDRKQYVKEYMEGFLKRPLSDAGFKSLYDEYVKNSSPDRPLEDFLTEKFFPDEYREKEKAGS